YTKTLQNDAIPIGGLGMHALSTLAYILAGQYGLFYLVPMFTILLIIAIDRISLKLFGRFVSFASVLFAGTTYWIIGFGVQLYTESIFTLFFIMGIYFLIKFHHDKKVTQIFLTSSFLVAAAFIRTNGIVSLPLEIILVIGVLFLPILQKSKKQEQKTTLNYFYFYFKTNQKSIYKVILFMMIPWIVFFLISGFYNYYFFGDPSLGSYESRPHSELEWSLKSALQNWSNDIFTWIDYNAVFLIPDKLFTIFSDNSTMINVTPWNHMWIGTLSLLLIFSAIIISFLTKNKRFDIVTVSLFIFATLFFYALGHMSRVFDLENYSPRNLVIYDARSPIRYMIPTFPLFHILLGYIMYKIWTINSESISKLSFKIPVKYLKFGFLTLVILFFIISFYDSFIFNQMIKGKFTNPQKELENHFPIKNEGLPEKSVIVGLEHYKTMEYGLIPFYPYWGFNFVRIDID
ncbi:MAG: 2 protein, partial [Nitrosarchaeum sp.]|nr:2 protein [Nitrosarchaeum sp.]